MVIYSVDKGEPIPVRRPNDIADGFYGLCIVSGFLALPLACIWYPDVLGGITGWFGSTHIARETPESVVSIVGWTFLFLPVLVAVLGYLVS